MSEVSPRPDAAALATLSAADKRRLLAELLAAKSAASKQRFPLSYAQQRLWFIDRLLPGQTAYLIPVALRLDGALDRAALQAGLQLVVQRHEILRTRIVEEAGEPLQIIEPQAELALPLIDLTATPATLQAGAIDAELRKLVGEPFDLARGLLLRCRLLALDAQAHVLLVVIHHIVADYWSLRVLMRELALAYAAAVSGKAPALPVLPIQYVDYAAWQHTQTAQDEAGLAYWREQLRGAPALLQLPTDRPRGHGQGARGARHGFQLPAALAAAASALAQREQTTLFVVLLTALQCVLYRYSGQEDFCVGSTVSNRDRAETRDLIGLFVNNLVLRGRFAPTLRFREALRRAHETVMGALAHQELPFERVVDALQIERQLEQHALFQVMFVLHNTPPAQVELPGLRLSAVDVAHDGVRFDLSLDMTATPDGLHGLLEFNAALFDRATIESLSRHLHRLLEAAVHAPELTLAELPLLDAADLRALETLNRTTQPIDELPAHRRFVAQAARRPEAIALCAGGRRCGYAELDAWTNRLARHLLARGARPGTTVAICLPRGAELVASLLAVLKIGACYLPLDPTHPPARLRHVLEDAVPALLIVDARLELPRDLLAGIDCVDPLREAAAIAGESASELAWTPAPDALAYVMYTSGSTGKPKGVPIAHLSLSNLLDAMASAPGLTAADALLAVTTIAFDIASLEVLLPLSVGARLVLADEHSVVDAARLATLLDDEAISCMQATPATWRLLLDGGWRGRPGLKMLCGGEALDVALARRLLDCGAELWNMYGPTETTIWSSALRLDAALLADGVVPLGGPIANTQFHLLDVCGQLAPTCVAGELVIGGAGLSPGYLKQPALSAQKFAEKSVLHSLATTSAPLRCYHTGDRLRRRADGLFEFLGRLDHQIKLRGYRIELGEIESVLNAHPALVESLVVLREDDGEPRLVAYCAVRDTTASSDALPAELRQLLLAQLPAYMLPAQFVLLAALPRTPNGKIDRQALPVPRDAPAPSRPLSTPTERALAELWQALLGRAVTGADDEFFALGGHSLLAARLIAQIQARFELALPLRLVFERPGLGALAAAIDAGLDESGAAPSLAVKIEPRPPGAPPVLSHAQERLWVLAQLEPDAAHYHMPAAVRLEGRFSLSAFEAALSHVCARHDVLRTAFPARQGKATVAWCTPAVPAITELRLDEPDSARRAARLDALLREAARAPFDLAQAPLLRALVVELGEREHVILLVMHHLLGDAWSLRLLFAELRHCHARFLAGLTPALPALSLSYADYAAWERGRDTSASLAYWQRKLDGAPALLDLPTDYPRSAHDGAAGDEVRFSVDAATRAALEALSRRHGATLFMCLLAAYKTLLHRFSGETDLVVGCPVGHRPLAALEGVLGVFVNTLAIRTDLAACRDFTALLAAVRANVLDGFAHQDAPFEEVIKALALPRHWQHAPLFQVMFLWQNAAPEARAEETPKEEADARWIPLPLATDTAKVDLSLSMAEEDGALLGRVEYRRDLFHRTTIETLIESFKTLLPALAAAPERRLDALPVVNPALAARLAAWNDTARDYPVGACLHEAFERQAAATPTALAVVAEDGELHYAALDAMANRIAHCLRRHGVRPESRVAVCMARKPGLIAALLGVLKAGGAYVPIDPAYPRTRVDYMLADAAIDIVVTDEAHRALFDATSCVSVCIDGLPEDLPASAPPVRLSPRNAAYVIYTSGSTGVPKGVTIEHASPVALVHWAREVYSADELRGVLAATSICFDLSIFEIFVPLSTGGTIVLADHALQLPELAARDRVTLVNTVPTAAAELARDPRLPTGIRTFNIAGEPLSTALVRELYARPGITAVYNLYGPSEDTTYSTFGLMMADEAGASSPIGRPIGNTRAYVLDARLAPVAPGMPGELYLAGAGLARGYWGRPALTAERFLPNPFAREHEPEDTLLYKTGDRVRFRHDDQLEFLGRLDEQVKIRGFRIEPGEIEAALLAQPEIAQATVRPWTDGEGRRSLVAYLVQTQAGIETAETLAASSPLVTSLRAALARRLPDFMLPAYFIALPALPLLPNGKIARSALPPPRPSERTSSDEAMSAQESALAEIWRQALGRSIGLHDNFFALGGDSILALSVIAQARAAGLHFTPRDLFEHPTVAGLAAIARATELSPVAQGPQIGRVPLSPIQHWFFELPLQHRGHWNQTILLEVKEALDEAQLTRALETLMKLHDGLRARFVHTEEGWEQHYGELELPAPLTILRTECACAADFIEAHASALQAELALERAPLWRAAYYDLKTPAGAVRRLLLVCHHLLVDGVSWRILLSDLLLLYRETAPVPSGNPGALSRWIDYLREELPVSAAVLAHWRALTEAPLPAFPLDLPQGRNLMGAAATESLTLEATTTRRLLQEVPAAYAIKPDELLLTALAQTLVAWQDHAQLRLELEAHGRPDGAAGHDLSHSLGWVTALFPVAIDLPPRAAPGAALKTVKQILRSTPDRGLSYGVLRHLRGALPPRADTGVVPLRFNYLGQTDQLFDAQSLFAPAAEATGASRHPADPRDAIFDVNVMVSRGELRVHWTYGGELHRRETVLMLARDFLARIAELVRYCLEAREDDGHVAADFPQMEFAPGELEDLLRRL